MKTSNKGFDQCGNAQAVANEDQIIVSADVTDQANDCRQVEPMVAQTLENLDAIGVTENIGSFTADAGYFSEENVTSLEANERIDAAYIATGRLKHHEQVPDAPKGRPPKGLTTKERMARKLRTKKGRAGIRSPESDRGTAVRPDQTLPGLPAVPASRPEADARRMETGVLNAQLAEGVPPRSIGQPLRNSNRGSLHLNPANQSSPSHRKPPSFHVHHDHANSKSNVGLKPDHPLRHLSSVPGHTPRQRQRFVGRSFHLHASHH